MHCIEAVMYAVINLQPNVRMSLLSIQVASLLYDHDAKVAGMVETINGGTTSVGAQLRERQHPVTVKMRKVSFEADGDGHYKMTIGKGREDRPFTVTCPLATGDFPAMASWLPTKGSTSAHRYDRLSPPSPPLPLLPSLSSAAKAVGRRQHLDSTRLESTRLDPTRRGQPSIT